MLIVMLSLNCFGGEFSDIDLTVRETLVDYFSKIEVSINYDDIEDLSLVENNKPDECFLIVKGNLKSTTVSTTESNIASITTEVFKFHVCVNVDPNAGYQGSVITIDLLPDDNVSN